MTSFPHLPRKTQIRYKMDVRRYVYIPTRTGASMACDIYRPCIKGRFPCLCMQTPYNKNNFDVAEARRYVHAGYVLCAVDIRGTGGSEGEFTYHNVADGKFDGADIVEWLAEQEFSDGRIGTFGGSAAGVSQLVTAEGKPEHLEAVFIASAPSNYYHDRWFPGGILNIQQVVRWQEHMTGFISPDIAVQNVSAKEGSIEAEGIRIRGGVRQWRLNRRYERSQEGTWTALQSKYLELCNTPEYGPIWESFNHEPFLSECEVPVYYAGVWFDHFLRGTCESYLAHKGPKKLIVLPGVQRTHGEQENVDLMELRLRWFDYWLKGIDNGIMDEPPVSLYVMGTEEWHTFNDWPVPNDKMQRLVCSERNMLTGAHGAKPAKYVLRHDPEGPLAGMAGTGIFDMRRYEEDALVFTTSPLKEDVTIIGGPVLHLRVRCSGEDGHLFVKLCDVFPDGRRRQVANGRLRLAHRKGHDRPCPMQPGKLEGLDIELWPVANVFRKGHSIRIVLACSEAPQARVFPDPFELEIVSEEGALSTLELPLAKTPR